MEAADAVGTLWPDFLHLLIGKLEDAPKVHGDIAGSGSHTTLEPVVGLLALALVEHLTSSDNASSINVDFLGVLLERGHDLRHICSLAVGLYVRQQLLHS